MDDRWEPIPRKYAGLTDEEVVEETEIYLRNLKEKYELLDRKKPEYLALIRRYLSSNEKFSMINGFLLEEEFDKLAGIDQDMYELRNISKVVLLEEELGMVSVLRRSGSLENCQRIFRILVYYFRRMEMEWEKASYDGFWVYVNDASVSLVAVFSFLTFGLVARKSYVAEKIAERYAKDGKEGEALESLFCMPLWRKEDGEMIMGLTDYLIRKNRMDLAYRMLLQFPEPDETVRNMQEKLKKRANI